MSSSLPGCYEGFRIRISRTDSNPKACHWMILGWGSDNPNWSTFFSSDDFQSTLWFWGFWSRFFSSSFEKYIPGTKSIAPPNITGFFNQTIPISKGSPWNAKCPICLGNFTPKTSNYCLKNRVLGFPGLSFWFQGSSFCTISCRPSPNTNSAAVPKELIGTFRSVQKQRKPLKHMKDFTSGNEIIKHSK